MSDEPTSALARLALDDVEEGGIDQDLADALMRALMDYPSFELACAACGVTDRSVASMLQRGVQPGAPRSLKAFAKGMALVDAELAKQHSESVARYLATGQPSCAKVMIDIMERRWKLSEQRNLMAILASGKRSDSLKARVLNPSSVLLSLFRMAITTPNLTWAALLEECGWVRAPKKHTKSPQDPAPVDELPEDDE